MSPRGANGGGDGGSSGVAFPLGESRTTVGKRLSSVQRISARSILKVWSGGKNTNNSGSPRSSPRSATKPSLKRLLRDHQVPRVPEIPVVEQLPDSPTAPISVDDHSPHPTSSVDDSSFHDVEESAPPEAIQTPQLQDNNEVTSTAMVISTPPRPSDKIPREVTVVVEGPASPASHLGVAGVAVTDGDDVVAIETSAEIEAREYKSQLQAAQELLDQITLELRRERNRVQDLIFQNKVLLDELQCVSGKDQASVDTHDMMKQEMFFLKLCLFLSGVFIMCGGRPSFLAILVLLWFAVDILAG